MRRFRGAATSAVLWCSVLFLAGVTPPPSSAPVTDGPVLLAHHQPRPAAGPAAGTTSDNWAGYVQDGSQDGTFTGVGDTLVVPTAVTPTAGTGYQSDWVGIGGYDYDPRNADTQSLIQAGVQMVVTTTDGKTRVAYEAWTEKLPGLEKRLKLMVKPGNTVALTVQETAKNRWTATVDTLPTGRSISRTFRYRSTGLSAEAIEERPCLGHPTTCGGDTGDYAPLAQTSNVTFEPGFFTETAPGTPPVDEPLLGTVPQAALLQLTMVEGSPEATPVAVPSTANTAEDGFTVADGSTAPPPPSP